MSYQTENPGRVMRGRRGFTLIEASMAMVIIGVAVGAMLQLLAAGTQSNLAGNEMTTGINLAKNIREIASGLAYNDPTNANSATTKEGSVSQYNDIWDLDGCNFSPPLDCSGLPISSYPNWTQSVKVQTVSPGKLDFPLPNDPTQGTARVTVTVKCAGRTVYQTSWLVAAPDSQN